MLGDYMDLVEKPLENIEFIIAIIATIFGLFSSLAIFIYNGFNFSGISFLGILALIGTILGFFGSLNIDKDKDVAGVCFVVGSILIVLHASIIGVIGAILFLALGVNSLFNK